jgi:hypothetical protein
MKLFRFEQEGKVKLGLATDEGQHLDISTSGMSLTENFLGANGLDQLRQWLKDHQHSCPIMVTPIHYL